MGFEICIRNGLQTVERLTAIASLQERSTTLFDISSRLACVTSGAGRSGAPRRSCVSMLVRLL